VNPVGDATTAAHDTMEDVSRPERGGMTAARWWDVGM
jgi:hypothetical protein